MQIRQVEQKDLGHLQTFLEKYKPYCMFLLNNLLISGLGFKDKPYHGDYWAIFDSDNRVYGTLAIYWNGNIMLHGEGLKHISQLLASFKQHNQYPIGGIIGENAFVLRAISELELENHQYNVNRKETLYTISASQLKRPSQLDENRHYLIPLQQLDKDILFQWLWDYEIEAMHQVPGDALKHHVNLRIDRFMQDEDCWALLQNEEPVALCGFNARIPDMVQLGPVFTPKTYRSKGFAKIMVYLALKSSQVQSAILFTDNPAATKAYQAIGFKPIGEYRLAILTQKTNV